MGFYAEHVFPRLYDRFAHHEELDRERARLIKNASGRTLEIGIGTGFNLALYPSGVEVLDAIEPSLGMSELLKDKVEQNTGPKLRLLQAKAERLPYESGYFDTVVSTLTLCSVDDVRVALAEIRRVLKPRGRFLFLEHGLSERASTARLQRLLNPLQRRLACGCQLTVDVDDEIETAGFALAELTTLDLRGIPGFLGHIYVGIAASASPDRQP